MTARNTTSAPMCRFWHGTGLVFWLHATLRRGTWAGPLMINLVSRPRPC